MQAYPAFRAEEHLSRLWIASLRLLLQLVGAHLELLTTEGYVSLGRLLTGTYPPYAQHALS